MHKKNNLGAKVRGDDPACYYHPHPPSCENIVNDSLVICAIILCRKIHVSTQLVKNICHKTKRKRKNRLCTGRIITKNKISCHKISFYITRHDGRQYKISQQIILSLKS